MNTLIKKTPSEVSQLPVAGLRKLASTLQIKNYGKHTKDELTSLVNEAIANQPVAETEAPAEPIIIPEAPVHEEAVVEEEAAPAEEAAEPTPAVEEEAPAAEETPAPEVAATPGDTTPAPTAEVVKEKVSRKAARIEVTPEMQAIIDDTAVVKSEKFRKLAEKGMSASQIAEATSSHYSFVHGVLQRKTTLIA